MAVPGFAGAGLLEADTAGAGVARARAVPLALDGLTAAPTRAVGVRAAAAREFGAGTNITSRRIPSAGSTANTTPSARRSTP